MLRRLHAVQHGPRKHEHCHPTHAVAVQLGRAHGRSGPVVVFLGLPADVNHRGGGR